MPSSFPFLGMILQFGAVVLGVVLGYKSTPVTVGIVYTGLAFQFAYTLIRLPQIIGVWQRTGVGGGFKLLFFQSCINLAIGGFFYGVGRGIGYMMR